VEEQVATTLKVNQEECKELAHVVNRYAKGNPLIVNQVLRRLAREHLINYDWEKNSWNWDLNKLKFKEDFNLDIFDVAVKNLPKTVREILGISALLQQPINQKFLATIPPMILQTGIPQLTTCIVESWNLEEALDIAVQQGFIANCGVDFFRFLIHFLFINCLLNIIS
jgi:predicted ATPase